MCCAFARKRVNGAITTRCWSTEFPTVNGWKSWGEGLDMGAE